MLTRLWQHRFYGLLATLLVGLAAAVLVMLLPDRQQAFARFVLDPAIVQTQEPQLLMDDQRLVNRVLQRLDVESPNLIDPRPVDPATAFKRNFGLRATGTPGEFEISYVGRSPESAAEGVKTWLAAANDVWRRDGVADTSVINASVAATTPDASAGPSAEEIAAARAALAGARDQIRALELEQSQLSEQLTVARADKTRFEAAQRQAANVLAQAREAAQASARADAASAAASVELGQTELRQAEQALSAAQNALTQASNDAEQSAAALVQVQQEQTRLNESLAGAQAALRAAQAAKADFAQVDAERTRNIAFARTAQLDRQRVAVERQLQQTVERRESLQRQFEQTPATIVEVVTDKEPVTSVRNGAGRQALIKKTKAELSELRIRFTDNHPDVRRQLAILADLESPGGTSNLSEAPTVGARPLERPNPRYTSLQEGLARTEKQAAQLRASLASLQSERERLAEQRAQPAGDADGKRARQASVTQAQRELANAQAALSNVQNRLRQATQRDADARAASNDAAVAVQRAQAGVASRRAQLARARQLAAAQKTDESILADNIAAGSPASDNGTKRQTLDDRLERLEQSLAVTRVALDAAARDIRQRVDELARLESAVAQAGRAAQSPMVNAATTPAQSLEVARGGLTVVQAAQVVPASSNPDRIQWLFFGLLASLLVGALVALALGVRRTAFSSVAELEQVTGLRALGGVPRFRSSRQTLGFWLSAALFVGLILVYGLIYLGFIAWVDSQSSLFAPDWDAWREAIIGLLGDGAARLGLGGKR